MNFQGSGPGWGAAPSGDPVWNQDPSLAVLWRRGGEERAWRGAVVVSGKDTANILVYHPSIPPARSTRHVIFQEKKTTSLTNVVYIEIRRLVQCEASLPLGIFKRRKPWRAGCVEMAHLSRVPDRQYESVRTGFLAVLFLWLNGSLLVVRSSPRWWDSSSHGAPCEGRARLTSPRGISGSRTACAVGWGPDIPVVGSDRTRESECIPVSH